MILKHGLSVSQATCKASNLNPRPRCQYCHYRWHDKVVRVGNISGRDIDKFAEFGLTSLPARQVAAPSIVECLANLECKVIDSRLVNKYNLFVLEAVEAWINPAQQTPKTGHGRFVVDGEIIELQSKMKSYTRTLA